MAADSAIFRSTNSGDNESNLATREVIEFNELPLINNSDQIISESEIEMNRALGRQARIRRNFSHMVEDTGFEGLTPIITGVIRTENIDVTEHIIKKWLLEDQFTTDFPLGRFGLRMGDHSVFNLTPTSERGYMIENFRLRRPGTHKGKLEFIGTLRFNGSIGTPNGNGEYIW